ncbi:MAG: DUF447 family protein [Sulfolobus sp.]
MDNNIIDLIFPHDGVFEVILGTTGVRPNLAPIGIIREKSVLKSKIYKSTLTYQNLQVNRKCSVNVTLDPLLFYYCFIGKCNWETYDDIPVLSNSLSIIAECDYEKLGSDPIIITYRIKNIIRNSSNMKAYSRGDALFIDFLVHLSRIDIYSDAEIKQFLPIIEYELKTISRLSPNLKDIVQRIADYLNSKGLKVSV